MSKVIIVALNHTQAHNYLLERQIKREDAYIVINENQVRGLKDLNYICVGQFYTMEDYAYVIDYLESHGCIDISNLNKCSLDEFQDVDVKSDYQVLGILLGVLFLLLFLSFFLHKF